jgi:hypothetical protein
MAIPVTGWGLYRTNKVSRDKLSLQNLKQLQLITKENIYIIWTKLYKDSKIVNCIKINWFMFMVYCFIGQDNLILFFVHVYDILFYRTRQSDIMVCYLYNVHVD